MTLLEKFDKFSAIYKLRGGSYRTVRADDIRRALAIAQAVDELDSIGTDEAPDWIKRRADELLEGK